MSTFRPGMPGIVLLLEASPLVASSGLIPYDTEDWSEQWPDWSAAGAVVPRTGTYAVTCWWSAAAVVLPSTRTIGLGKNGVYLFGSDRYPASNGAIRGTVSSSIRAAAGDVITANFVSSNVVANVFTGTVNRLAIVRCGPERWTG